MKKLFTTLLLLGAVVGTQAQVTITAFDPDNGTVTINYDASLGVATEKMVDDAIKAAFGGPGVQNPTYPGYHGPQATADFKDVVSTIILTGDWSNRDTDKDNVKTIKKIVDEFKKGESLDTLDLSACQKFVSKFVSVYDTAGGETLAADEWSSGFKSEQLHTYFTAQTKQDDEVYTYTVTRTETPYHTKTVTVSRYSEGDINAACPDFITNLEGDEVDYTATYSLEDGSTIAYFEEGDQVQVGEDWQGNPVYWTVPSEGWWWYKSQYENGKLNPVIVEDEGVTVTYTYTDDAGIEHVVDEGDVTEEGGVYTYVVTVTYEDKPFAITKDYKIGGIIYPNSDNFTFVPGEMFVSDAGLKKVVLSDKIVAIGNKAFEKCVNLSEVNFPASLREIGNVAFEQTAITEANLAACTNLTRIRRETFELCANLTTVTFPTGIIEVQSEAFYKAGLTDADFSACHDLRMLAQFSFGECPNLVNVKVCSHPKTIKGPDHGNGAFNESLAIRTVEVVACDDVTDITQCVCETGAFTFDVTNAQTSVESVEQAARLIYPRTMPVGSDSEYTSAFDFFVGDYKEGALCTSHDDLLDYWYNVPNSSTGTTQLTKDQSVTIGKQLYAGNGWFEFINTGDGITIEPDEGTFLRTYSRTEESGPVLLPSTITAYRAIDYASTGTGYVGKKNGEYVNINEYETDAEPVYQVYADMSAEDKVTYKNYPRYSILTVKGELLLRPLRPLKVVDKSVPRSEWTFAESATESYVPENTGVVLYSTNISEDAFMVFKAYTEYDYKFPEYPHTGLDRCEEDRLDKGGEVGVIYDNGLEINDPDNLSDNINMLQGSYGSEHKVAPVLPWNWEKNTYYKNNMQYRNFGFNKSVGKWRRLTPGVLRLNRAWAMIPIGRFDNHNENTDQMPDFTLEDHVTNNSNTILVIGSSFEDDEVDGIRTISTSTQSYEKDAWYTLQGVRVDNPTKGVYIHNNKKVVIK